MARPLSDSDSVFQSYGRCCAREQFFEDFYRIFMGRSDAVRQMFTNTDMAEQRRLLRAGISWLVMYSRGAPGGKLRDLGKTHDREGYNVPPALYAVWLDALMETVQLHDPEYTSELDRQWRAVLNPGIDLIRDAY
ncbi:globin [Alcanivorax quisquiliarum]|uniref:Globin n=1 Tax=Alcanivorax quisquiliarum TaxID=2933565 RepID=A0ABT0E7M7_9GAMM|nr:globin [Alcanivorax quisquiliarum]MCK0537841.1 globin [Alcanivorax quisquiliarum]